MGHWFHPKYPVMSPPGQLDPRLYRRSAVFSSFTVRRSFRTISTSGEYPIEHGDAARTDIAVQPAMGPPHSQILLPEIILLHLESDGGRLGANWKGRTTPRFGPPARPRLPETAVLLLTFPARQIFVRIIAERQLSNHTPHFRSPAMKTRRTCQDLITITGRPGGRGTRTEIQRASIELGAAMAKRGYLIEMGPRPGWATIWQPVSCRGGKPGFAFSDLTS